MRQELAQQCLRIVLPLSPDSDQRQAGRLEGRVVKLITLLAPFSVMALVVQLHGHERLECAWRTEQEVNVLLVDSIGVLPKLFAICREKNVTQPKLGTDPSVMAHR